MNVGTYILSLKKKYIEEPGHTTSGYLEPGLSLFHKYRETKVSCKEPAVNNLSTAVELLLKTYIAHKHPGIIFIYF